MRLSRDREVVVFHDRALRRLTGAEGRVEDRTAAELCALPLLGTTERIPLLRDVLDLVGGRVPLLVEPKPTALSAALESGVVEALRGYDGPVAIQCFKRRSLWHLDRFEARHAVGHLSLGRVPAAIGRPGFLGCPVEALPSRAVRRRRAAGAVVLAWTVRCAEQAERALRFADNYIFEGWLPGTGLPGARGHGPRAPETPPAPCPARRAGRGATRPHR